MIAGRYRLEREIGRGGSGTVHLALDEVLGRKVAIKRIGTAPGSDDVERERAELCRWRQAWRLRLLLRAPEGVVQKIRHSETRSRCVSGSLSSGWLKSKKDAD